MGSFLQNNRAYNIKSETGLAHILTYFDSNFVIGTMDDTLREIDYTFSNLSKLNIVNAFEDNFKAILIQYPEEKDQILACRQTTYQNEIIPKLAQHFNFEFRPSEDMDIYGITYTLYDFYIANYNVYIVKLLTDYIIRNKDTIYVDFGLDQFKKSKDVSTITNKQLIDDPVMAIISSNVEYILQYITEVDFPMETILNVIYDYNYSIVNIFLTHVFPKTDLFRSYYCRLINNPNTRIDVISSIKWEIMKRCSNNSINLDF